METQVYSIYDAKTKVFSKPFHALTEGEAERSFQQVVNDDRSNLFQFPEDYDLYYIGRYDDQTGLFKCLASPEHRVKAVTVKGTSKGPVTPVQINPGLSTAIPLNRSTRRKSKK